MIQCIFQLMLILIMFSNSSNYEDLVGDNILSERPNKKSPQLRTFIDDVNRANRDLNWIREAASAVNPNLVQVSFRTPSRLSEHHWKGRTRHRRDSDVDNTMALPQEEEPSDSDLGIDHKVLSRIGHIERQDSNAPPDSDLDETAQWNPGQYAGSMPISQLHNANLDYDLTNKDNANKGAWDTELKERANYQQQQPDELQPHPNDDFIFQKNDKNMDLSINKDLIKVPKFDYSNSFGISAKENRLSDQRRYGNFDHKSVVKRHLNPEDEINLKISAKLFSKGFRSPLPYYMFKDSNENNNQNADSRPGDRSEEVTQANALDGENYNEYLGASRYRSRSLKSIEEPKETNVSKLHDELPPSVFDHHDTNLSMPALEKTLLDQTNNFQNMFMKLDNYDSTVERELQSRRKGPGDTLTTELDVVEPESSLVYTNFPAPPPRPVTATSPLSTASTPSTPSDQPDSDSDSEDKQILFPMDEPRLTDDAKPIPLAKTKTKLHTRSDKSFKHALETAKNNMTDLEKALTTESDLNNVLKLTCGHSEVTVAEPGTVVTKSKRTEKEEELEIKESMHGQLPRRLMTAIVNMIQSNNVLRGYLGPGMTKKLTYGNMALGQQLTPPTAENVIEVRKMEIMLRQVMSVLNRIVEEQVRLRTCIGPRSELLTFLQWVLRHEPEITDAANYLEEGGMPLPTLRRPDTQKSSTQDPFLFPDAVNVPDHEILGPDTLQRKIALVRKLIGEYENLSEHDKIQVRDVHDYLYKHLDLLLHLLGQEVKLRAFPGNYTSLSEDSTTGISTSTSTNNTTVSAANITVSTTQVTTTVEHTTVAGNTTTASGITISTAVTISNNTQNKRSPSSKTFKYKEKRALPSIAVTENSALHQSSTDENDKHTSHLLLGKNNLPGIHKNITADVRSSCTSTPITADAKGSKSKSSHAESLSTKSMSSTTRARGKHSPSTTVPSTSQIQLHNTTVI